MRAYTCDICGETGFIMSDLFCIDFSHYGSSGTTHNYTDACLACADEIKGFMDKMKENKEKLKITLEALDKAGEAAERLLTESELRQKEALEKLSKKRY
jgi:hypothetical protein